MSVWTDLAIPTTLQDMCDSRDRALARVKQAEDILASASDELDKIARYAMPYGASMRDSLSQIRKEMDRRLWSAAFDKTGFMQLMDAEAKRRFEADLDKDPPAFTMDNVRSTFASLFQDAETMYARGIVNVFLRLSKAYKTNRKEPFKVARKAILGYMVESNYSGGLRVGYYAQATVNDIDRVFKTLDGKQHQPRSLETALNAALQKGEVYEDDYYRIKGFKNRNMHIEFKRDDLLQKANRIIHDYYNGEALAA